MFSLSKKNLFISLVVCIFSFSLSNCLSASAQTTDPAIEAMQPLFDPIRLQLRGGDLSAVEINMSNQLTQARSAGDGPAEAQLLNDLGLVTMLEGKFDQATAHCSQSLSLREQIFGVDSNPCVDNLNALAAISFAKGDLEDTKQKLDSAALIEQKDAGANLIKSADSADIRARLLIDQSKIKEAQSPAQSAFDIRSQRLGDSSPAVGESLFTLGIIDLQTGKAKKALSDFDRSLQVNDPELIAPKSLMALALVSLRGSRFADSEQFYDKAVAAQETLHGNEDQAVATYRALYLKQLWDHRHYLAALTLRHQMSAPQETYLRLDPSLRLLSKALLKMPAHSLRWQYDRTHMLMIVGIALLALLLIAAILRAPGLILSMPLESEFNQVANKHGSQNMPGSGVPTGQKQPQGKAAAAKGRLRLIPFADYIPNWHRQDDD